MCNTVGLLTILAPTHFDKIVTKTSTNFRFVNKPVFSILKKAIKVI